MAAFDVSALAYPKHITYNFAEQEKRKPVRLTYDGTAYSGVLLANTAGTTSGHRIRLTERLSDDLRTSYYMAPREIVLQTLDGVTLLNAGHHH